MFEGVADGRAGQADRGWQDRVRTGLRGRFHGIARAIFGNGSARKLEFSLIKEGPLATSLEVRQDARRVFLKLFDRDSDRAREAYKRERGAYIALRHTGLVPELIGFDDGARFFATGFIEGHKLNSEGLDMSPVEIAFRLGYWTAQLDARSPARPASGTWYDYLARYGSALALDQIASARAVLSGIPLCGLAMSHGDAALHNFLVDRDNQLFACDFEAARMRPRGWDFIMTHMALIQRFPEAQGRVLPAFADGFSHVHQGAMIVDELCSLARIMTCAHALAGPERKEG